MPDTHATLIGRILPPGAACHECPPEPVRLQLHPVEERYLAESRMSERRRREYALGRWCARRAMTVFRRGDGPLLSTASRAPAWPNGLVGSITHCEGYCAAAVATTESLAAIGIDAERWQAMPPDVGSHIASVEDYQLSSLDRSDIKSLALIFSAKESVFKALNPLTGSFFDFLSVTLRVDTEAGLFSIASARVPEVASHAPRLAGRFLVTDELVLTSAYILP